MRGYHVAADGWDGGDLVSLYERYGADAYEMYADRWPEAAELAQYHAHYVHLYGTAGEAVEHQEQFGGIILAVDIPDEAEITIETDSLEFPHPIVRDRIPARYISVYGV